MDFELSEDVVLFREMVHRWVDQECPKDWCRELERREHVYPQELWDKLAEAGCR
jgi:alkylation response protein AidB-like acyl-CoA dehydrogenase